ncbi:MAG: tRNA adenosine(34) deaminase TadA [Cyanobacteria bacterium P01_E01_bin.42]
MVLELNAEMYRIHTRWMTRALELAKEAGDAGDVPVGAVIVDGTGEAIAEASNRKERDRDPTAHAEILALREAARMKKSWHLEDCTLYVTLEPCPMCAGAIVHARVGLLVYGVDDPKTGTIRTVLNLPDSPCSNHTLPAIAGILETPCREQLQHWFKCRRRDTEQTTRNTPQ